jgi:hypothetical protein
MYILFCDSTTGRIAEGINIYFNSAVSYAHLLLANIKGFLPDLGDCSGHPA